MSLYVIHIRLSIQINKTKLNAYTHFCKKYISLLNVSIFVWNNYYILYINYYILICEKLCTIYWHKYQLTNWSLYCSEKGALICHLSTTSDIAEWVCVIFCFLVQETHQFFSCIFGIKWTVFFWKKELI